MRIFLKIAVVLLVFLAISSGITKIMLMPQDVEFFGRFGFNNPLLIAFGVAQLIGGLLMIVRKTRFFGAVVVAITFAASAILLVMAGNILVALITFVMLILLVMIALQTRPQEKNLPT